MGSLNRAATIMASKKELGWLAQINTGPLIAMAAFDGTIIPGQKILSASLIIGLSKK
jgi:hypothetical protein